MRPEKSLYVLCLIQVVLYLIYIDVFELCQLVPSVFFESSYFDLIL